MGTTIEIDLAEVYAGGEDGPGSVAEAVVFKAAALVLADYDRNGLRAKAAELVEEGLREVISREAEEIAREALDTPVRKTDRYGDPRGEPLPLRSWIAEEMRGQLTLRDKDHHSGSNRNLLSKIIHDEVERQVGGELRKALDAGKAEVLAAIRAKGIEVLTETLKRSMPL